MTAAQNPAISTSGILRASASPVPVAAVAAASGPAGSPGTPGTGPLRNGNCRGNPALAPRCGARARTTGHPCRAPAMPNGRCRMHGGACTGPNTPEGRARMIAANTRHGGFTAPKRAAQRLVRAVIARTRLLATARRLWRYLPPEMAARLEDVPVELFIPIHASNLPFATPADAMPYTVSIREVVPVVSRRAPVPVVTPRPAAGAPRASHPGKATPPTARDAERLAARAEAASQAPWREAIAVARAARLADRQACAARRQTRFAERNSIHREPAARTGGAPAACPSAENVAHPGGATVAPAWVSVLSASACLASARHAATAVRSLRSTPAGGQNENPQRNPIHRETAANARLSALSLLARLASEKLRPSSPVGAPRGTGASSQTGKPQRNPMHRERPGVRFARVTPGEALDGTILGSTTLAGAWNLDVARVIDASFGRAVSAPGWFVPRAIRVAGPVAAAVRGFMAERHRAAAAAAGQSGAATFPSASCCHCERRGAIPRGDRPRMGIASSLRSSQ